MIKLIFIIGLLVSCVSANENTKKDKGDYEKVNFVLDLYRYENNEVVCYVLHGVRRGGLTCKWKGEK